MNLSFNIFVTLFLSELC